MTRNPFLNALAATIYIVTVALVMFYATRNLPQEDTILAPIAAISVFTLSAAVMVYVFFYQPVMLYLEGKKRAGVELFTKTLGIFAAATFIILMLLFSGVVK